VGAPAAGGPPGADADPPPLTPSERAAYQAVLSGGGTGKAAVWALGSVPEIEPPPELCPPGGGAAAAGGGMSYAAAAGAGGYGGGGRGGGAQPPATGAGIFGAVRQGAAPATAGIFGRRA
jgi:hypothetical protein